MKDDINQDFHPKELLNLLDLDLARLAVNWDSSTSLDHEFEVQAADFLEFAKLDIQEPTERGLINALSNAKRSIDCQVDTVLGCFGLMSQHNFPQRLEVLNKMGIITPRILNKVVKARNYLEHEYKKPDLEQVEDAVDIASLFTSLVDQSLRHFIIDFSIQAVVDGVYDDGYPFADKSLGIEYDDKNMQFILKGLVFDEIPTPESRKAHWIERAIIRPKNLGYMELIRLAISLNNRTSDEKLISQATHFLQLFDSR